MTTNPADKQKAIETRIANQQRTAGLAQTPDKSNEATLLSYSRHRARRPPTRRCTARPTRSPRKLEVLRDAGFEQILHQRPAGSRENLRRFARDVMPAFSGARGRTAPRLVKG